MVSKTEAARYGLARVISKRGLASRSVAAAWVANGRVRVDGRCVRDTEAPTALDARIEIDQSVATAAVPIYLALNKPRGLITSTQDEHGRATIYACLQNLDLPWVAPVGRLDKASEGLLLLSNDPVWAAAITGPEHHQSKVYHVQVRPLPTTADLAALLAGVVVAPGEAPMHAAAARSIRHGEKSAWLEIVLDQGRNRQIRRMLQALGLSVERLLRVAIGPVTLGELGKGRVRHLTPDEVAALRKVGSHQTL
jgi:23S rRNA pseudouridine2605 synthase